MARKTKQRERAAGHPDGAPPTGTPAGAWLADAGRQQLAVAAAGTRAFLRGLDAMRRIHEQALQQVSRDRTAAAATLRGNLQPARFLGVQAELLRKDMEQASGYWQQMAAAAMEMNSEIMGCTAQLVDTEAVFAAAHGRLPRA